MFVPLLAAATLYSLGATPPPDWSIATMRSQIVAESPLIALLGVNPRDYVFRLDYLAGRIGRLAPSAPAQTRGDLQQEAALELKLDAELLVNLCPTFGAVHGLDESFYNDDPAIPPDPVALYVPAPDPNGRYAIVVLLHGRGETETDAVSHAVFRRLADRYHAILVAPWGTGSELWGRAATGEVMQIAREVEQAFRVDRRRIYLAGIALGGAAVFHIAAEHADFDAVLSIDGGLLPEDVFLATHSLRNRAVYLVGGGRDALTAPAVQEATYRALAAQCVPVSSYPTNDASGDLYQGGGAIDRAWGDMFDGVVRNANNRECTVL